MNNISNLVNNLIETLDSPQDFSKIYTSWKEYSLIWPDISKAYEFLIYNLLLKFKNDKNAITLMSNSLKNLKLALEYHNSMLHNNGSGNEI